MDVETAIAAISAFGSVVSAAATTVAAVGIWAGIRSMDRANTTHAAQAAEDWEVTQAIMVALERQGAALERRGAVLETLIRRTALPQSGSEE